MNAADTKGLEDKIDRLKVSVDALVLIELCKRGVARDGARKILGKLDNNLFANINQVINAKERRGHGQQKVE